MPGKHEKPTEKDFLEVACEIEDAIKSLEPMGVIGFTGMGIQLYSKVFKENFKDYRTSERDGDGHYLFAERNGHRFCAYEYEEEK